MQRSLRKLPRLSKRRHCNEYGDREEAHSQGSTDRMLRNRFRCSETFKLRSLGEEEGAEKEGRKIINKGNLGPYLKHVNWPVEVCLQSRLLSLPRSLALSHPLSHSLLLDTRSSIIQWNRSQIHSPSWRLHEALCRCCACAACWCSCSRRMSPLRKRICRSSFPSRRDSEVQGSIFEAIGLQQPRRPSNPLHAGK